MRHASCRELYQYWDRIREGASAPLRNAIEPAEIRGILCDTFIIEVGSGGRHPFRLAGTRLCAAYGQELKGIDFLDIWTPGDRPQVGHLLAAVAGNAQAAVAGVLMRSAQQRTLAYELLLLPLVQEGPRFDRILGVLAPVDVPYWLGLDPLVSQMIVSARLLWPDDAEATSIRVGAPADIGASLDPFGPARRRERFVVVKGGKPAG